MANTKTTQVIGGNADRRLIIIYNIVSDGSQETATTIYQNSSYVNDVTKGKLMRLSVSGYSTAGNIKLFWKATTNQPIISFSPLYNHKFKFEEFGGIPNTHGTGATGDLIITTLGLAAADTITLVLEILQA